MLLRGQFSVLCWELWACLLVINNLLPIAHLGNIAGPAQATEQSRSWEPLWVLLYLPWWVFPCKWVVLASK